MRILPNLLTAIKASNFGTKVVISASNDIYTNLAMEDWIYTRMKEINEPILMLWRNNPCIVIGRHQNPWLEARLKHLEKNGVVLARRNSGGGTVYHDMGNLNCTFFTDKKHYSRKSNLEFLCSALKSRWPLDIEVSSRDDIILQQKYKISGTAAKLGRCEAYHHLTVLFNANKEILHDVLRNSATPLPGVESKATRSVAAPVKNLTEVDPSINYESLIETITRQIRVQDEDCMPTVVWPNESTFPGITKLRDQLTSWEWIYGKCPPFIIATESTMLKVTKGIIEESSGYLKDYKGLRFPYNLSNVLTVDDRQANDLIELLKHIF
ncbi:Lipoyltransferase 1, mitochondrial [Chamberlinius hualienensis]